MRRQVVMSATGIGDNMIALTCCAGLKAQYPQDEIVFCTTQPSWMEHFDGWDILSKAEQPAMMTYRPYDSYKIELHERGKRTRAEYYAMLCGNVKPVLPTHKPLPPFRCEGHIVLAPFTCWESRQWLLAHWLELEQLLHKAGQTTLIIDDRLDRTQKFRGEKLLGQKPLTILSAIKQAKALIGNDSGMSHVAGALGTRTLVVCAAAKGTSVFGVWPSVEVLQGKLSCSGCYWRGEAFLPECNRVCGSLQTVSPKEVVDKLLSLP